MSKLTRCNRCKLRLIRADARRGGLLVTLKRNDSGFFGQGINVYAHPREWRPPAQHIPNQTPYWVAWFMALGKRCEC